jgi:hypothetical protein
MWIQVAEPVGGGLAFRATDVVGAEKDLSLQVAFVDDIGVDETEAADAGSGEVHEGGRPETTGADAEDAAIFQA